MRPHAAARAARTPRLTGGALCGSDLAATLYYNTKRKSVDYKLAASRQLGAGRGVEAEVAADGVDVSYFDSTFEEGAKWTATLSAPFSRLSDAGVQLRRTMSF